MDKIEKRVAAIIKDKWQPSPFKMITYAPIYGVTPVIIGEGAPTPGVINAETQATTPNYQGEIGTYMELSMGNPSQLKFEKQRKFGYY